MLKGLLLVNPPADLDLPELAPGAFVALVTPDPLRLEPRRLGLEFRDTLTALAPGRSQACLLLRVPLGVATLAYNALTHGCGGLAIDACRIRWQGEADREAGKPGSMPGEQGTIFRMRNRAHLDPDEKQNQIGRWPTNLALIHDHSCRVIGTASGKAPRICRYDDGLRVFTPGEGHPYTATGGGAEDVPLWECSPGCPVAALDAQSGVLKTTYVAEHRANNRSGEILGGMGHPGVQGYNDVGGASRYYPQFANEPEFLDWLQMLISPPGETAARRLFA